MSRIAAEFDYALIMVSNQDGLGTESFPEDKFWPVQNFIVKSFANEDVHFSAFHFDKTFAKDNAATRKPGIGMFTGYLNNPDYDIVNSYVIGDRITDVQLAKNLGCKAIWLNQDPNLGAGEIQDKVAELRPFIALEITHWSTIYEYLKLRLRHVIHERNTNETQIKIELNVDGRGKGAIYTGLGFFDHML